MNADSLKRAVERHRGETPYSKWTVGITEDHHRRKKEHGNPPSWDWWPADNEKVAREVETYFLKKGMKGDTGGGNTPKIIYMFKH